MGALLSTIWGRPRHIETPQDRFYKVLRKILYGIDFENYISFQYQDVDMGDHFVDKLEELNDCKLNRQHFRTSIQKMIRRKSHLKFDISDAPIVGLQAPTIITKDPCIELQFVMRFNTIIYPSDIYTYMLYQHSTIDLYFVHHPLVVIISHEMGHLNDSMTNFTELIATKENEELTNDILKKNFKKLNKKRFLSKFEGLTKYVVEEIKGIIHDDTYDAIDGKKDPKELLPCFKEKFFVDMAKRFPISQVSTDVMVRAAERLYGDGNRTLIDAIKVDKASQSNADKFFRIVEVAFAYYHTYKVWNGANYDDLLNILEKTDEDDHAVYSEGAFLKEYDEKFPGRIWIFRAWDLIINAKGCFSLPGQMSKYQSYNHDKLFGGIPIRYGHLSVREIFDGFFYYASKTGKLEVQSQHNKLREFVVMFLEEYRRDYSILKQKQPALQERGMYLGAACFALLTFALFLLV